MFKNLFTRHKRTAAVPNEPQSGAYVWIYEGVIRLLFLGNEPFIMGCASDTQIAKFRQLREDLLGTLNIDKSPVTLHSVRIYANYIAIDGWVSPLPTDLQAECSLEIIRKHLGWDRLSILGRVGSLTEYGHLNDHCNQRWPLGIYQ